MFSPAMQIQRNGADMSSNGNVLEVKHLSYAYGDRWGGAVLL